jgi:hypothetical protein
LNNLSNYSDFLASKGASFETVATRIGFDENVAYPRFSFEVIDWLDDEQQLLATGEHGDGGMCAHPLIERMLSDGSGPAAPATIVEQPPHRNITLTGTGYDPATGRTTRDPTLEPKPEPVQEPEENDDFAEEEAPPPKAARDEVVKEAPQTLDTAKPGTTTRGRPRKTANGNGVIKPTALPVSAPASLEADIESALDNLLGE